MANVKQISIVVPVYNEAATLNKVVKQIERASVFGLRKELILVDDGSSDGSEKILANLKKKHKVIRHDQNLGYGAALKSGFSAATGDIILLHDADLEYDTADFKKLIKPIKDGKAQAVYGTRVGTENYRPARWSHRIEVKLFMWVFWLFSGRRFVDINSSKAIRADIVKPLQLSANGFEFEVELTKKLLQKNVVIKEVSVNYHGRGASEGKKLNFRGRANMVAAIPKYCWPPKGFVKPVIFLLLLIFYSIMILHKFQLPAALDLPRQIKEGQVILHHGVFRTNYFSYTQPNAPFVNYYWLASVIFYLIYLIGGFVALSLLGLVVLLAAFSIIFFVARKFADFYLVALLALPTIIFLGIRSDVRPEIFSYLFFSIFLLFLYNFKENPRSKKIYWLIPLQILWVNIHLLFFLGPALVAGFLCEQAILSRHNIKANPAIKKLAWLLVGLVAACLINPFGLSGALAPYYQWKSYLDFPAQTIENYTVPEFIRTYSINISLAVTTLVPAAVLLAASFIFGFRRKDKPILLFLLSIATIYLGYHTSRGLALFGFIFLFAVSYNMSDIFNRFKDWLLERLPKPKLLPAAALFFALAILYLILVNQNKSPTKEQVRGFGLAPMSDCGAKFFKSNHLSGPVFNDADIGSCLIFELFPSQKVYTDNRFYASYSGEFFKRYRADLSDSATWKADLARYKFNTIIINQYDLGVNDFLYQRIGDPQWALVYVDRYTFVFVKNTLANQRVISKYKITAQNAYSRLGFLINSNDANDQIAAADILKTVGQTNQAIKVDQEVVNKWPNKNRIWFIIGKWQLQNIASVQSQYEALQNIQKAIGQGYKTAETYTYLGIADYNLGRVPEAKLALAQALKIDPTYHYGQQIKAYINKNQNNL